jgi:hypothetical protein
MTYLGLEDLIPVIVPMPATAFIHRFEAGLEMMSCDCFERCCEGMADPRISVLITKPHSSMNKKRLKDMGSRNRVKDRKMLGTEVNHGHRLPIVTKDVSPETEFTGVVNRHFDEWNTPTSQKESSCRHAVDGR